MDQGQIVLQGTLQAVFAGENWEQLSDLYIHPPHAAQLAERIGIQAMTVDEAIAKIQSSSQPAT